MTPHSLQRGSILIYAMLTMSAMLAIGLTLTGLFVGKLKSAGEARNSTLAIYAADSAVEKCLYEAREKKKTDPQLPVMVFTSGATYKITSADIGNTDVTLDCSALGSASFGFRATGEYRGVRRTLEISQ